LTGFVDEYGRALVRLAVRHPITGAEAVWDGWIDTACTGELVLSLDHIRSLGLQPASSARVALGDGSEVRLDTYTCLVEWFGERLEIEAIANAGRYPLIGVGLLAGHELNISYQALTVHLA
jgi:predicted aspartyl protease